MPNLLTHASDELQRVADGVSVTRSHEAVDSLLLRGRHQAASPGTSRIAITLLGGFHVTRNSQRVSLSGGCQRLLAFVALQGKPVSRSRAAGTLWPDVPEVKAFANLRATLTRLDPSSRLALDVTPVELAVAAGVSVDLCDAQEAAQRILQPGGARREAGGGTSSPIAALSADLLPGWYDDWAVFAIEDWHQLRVCALEMLAPELCRAGRFAEGAAAARAAVRADPLRESARWALIVAYLSAGDRCAAIREFAAYDVTVQGELGIRPSSGLRALIRELMPDSSTG